MKLKEKIKKAYEALKTMAEFSPEYETFREIFYQNLKDGKEDKAIEYLLMVVFYLLKSEGEVFNEILQRSDKKEDLINWLKQTREKL